VLASILIPVLAPVAVSTTIELSGWIQAGSLSVTVFAGLTLCEMHTWLEDVDGDGEWEQVVKVLLPDMKGYYLYHIEEDGAMYLYKCDQYGNKEMKWILVPNPDYPDGYKIYVWDEETSTYLPDQDKDGVPDSPEDQGASEETDAHGGSG
jgi:hypothetical protein